MSAAAAGPAIQAEVAGEGIISEHQSGNRFPGEIRLKVRKRRFVMREFEY